MLFFGVLGNGRAEGPAVLHQAVPLSKEFCSQYLTAHHPDANVAYEPGKDAEGNPVTPADLNAVTVALPKVIRLPITIQKKTRLGIETSGTLQTQGSTSASGTTSQTVAGVLKSSGSTSLDANQQKLTAFLATLPNNANTLVSNLSLSQVNTLADLLTVTSTQTGAVLGIAKGTTQSQGTFSGSGSVQQSGVGTPMPYGTLQTPYVDQIPLGYVEFSLETGEIMYNGQKLNQTDQALLQESCRKVLNP